MLREALVVSVVLILGQPALGADAECESASTNRGAKLFAEHCGHCHGEKGRGGGEMTKELNGKLPDLTRLATANEGQFPEKRLREVIDGRDVEAHSPDMPSWGVTFHVTVDTEAQVTGRICDLVAYLRSIQTSTAK